MAKPLGTLADLAKICEVHPSTVSRVLNNSNKGRFSVSPDVRQRIIEAAAKLQYQPSVAARNLTVGKTQLIAVMGLGGFYSDHVGPIEHAVSAMGKALDRAGYEICVQLVSTRHGPYAMPPLRVDGAVAIFAQSEADIDALDTLGVPYVTVHGVTGKRGSSVSFDDARGTRIALKHLVDLGHRRIAYLGNLSIGAKHPSVRERREAYYAASFEMGFEIPQVALQTMPPGTEWEAYYAPFVRSAIIEGGATAVLAYSHQGALGLMRTAHDLGLKVPDDFSLVCFNNEPSARLSIPSLTAVDLPAARMGELAAEILIRAMTSPSPMTPVHVRLDESLVPRESTSRPKTHLSPRSSHDQGMVVGDRAATVTLASTSPGDVAVI